MASPRSPWLVAADAIDPQGTNYAGDPVAWANDNSVSLWSKQVEILESVVVNHDTAVHSCHNAGKSFTAAFAAAWWLASHPPGTAFVITTAPTGDQVKAILWREIGRLHRALGLEGRVNLTEWYIGGEIVAMGRKPNEYDPSSFQGIHAIYVLVIIDEACGVPGALWEAGSSMTSNDTGRMLAIGNPDDPNSDFAKKCKPGSGWKVIHIGAEDTPNFTGERVAPIVSQSLITPNWADSKKLEWGADSPLYLSKVKGIFPVDAEDGVVPASWATGCTKLDLEAAGPIKIGFDVGAGGDQAVMRARQGRKLLEQSVRSRHGDPERLMGECLQFVVELSAIGPVEEILIDSNGIGWGIAGWLQEKRKEGIHNALVTPINVGSASSEPKRFINLRAEIWWNVGRELSRAKNWDLEFAGDACLAELIEPKYKINSSGKIVIEKKEDVKKRLGRSPDDADALLLLFYDSHSQVESFGEKLRTARIPGVKKR